MKLEAKIENPITLKLSPKENVIISDEERLPLESGAVFGGDHYGFNLIVEKNGEETSTSYPTQCRIYGTQMSDGKVFVFEDHKYIPWKFLADGTMVSNAIFSSLKRDEWDYVKTTYGVQTEDDLKELNYYQKSGKR